MEKVDTHGKEAPQFKVLEKYSRILDSSIRIPGTQRTIGLDPIIGFIPVVGDLAGYGFSVTLLYYAIKHGCSKRLIIKMMGNAALDAFMGMIPFVGTIFDFVYKSNERNLNMFMEYHEQGMHRESTLPIFLVLAGVSFLLLVAFSYLAYVIADFLWAMAAPLLGS